MSIYHLETTEGCYVIKAYSLKEAFAKLPKGSELVGLTISNPVKKG
jgi:hypothetical protein